MNNRNKAGWILLVIGALCLVGGLVLGFTLGTIWVPLLIGGSVLLNTVAVRMIRYKGGEGEDEQ